jgi:glycerol-3-phosphate acyltransferase PlsY
MNGFAASGCLAFYVGVLLGYSPIIALAGTLIMLLTRATLEAAHAISEEEEL